MSLCRGSLKWAGYHTCPTEKLYMSGINANCTNIAINRQGKPYILMSLCRGSLKWAGYHTCPTEKLYMSGIMQIAQVSQLTGKKSLIYH